LLHQQQVPEADPQNKTLNVWGPLSSHNHFKKEANAGTLLRQWQGAGE
jgi:hypothetical protein